jgi:mono/diheme cytochrome c family protein
VTEIPEHLLKRSKDRRAALGLGGDEGGEASTAVAPTASAAPAATAAAAPPAPTGPAGRKGAAPATPAPPPKPDSPVVAASKKRAKIPYWAMGALSLLPIWGFMYIRALTDAPEEASGPLAIGEEVYGSCASCHGADGGGGVGYQFSEGEVLKTFPHIEDQLRFVSYGTAEYQAAGVEIYGNPEREGGVHPTGGFGVMPAQSGELTEYEILGVVCHERYTLSGADPASEEYLEEYENWCSEESPVFIALEAGGTLAGLADLGITGVDGEPLEFLPIGEVPIPGSPPDA